MKQFFAPLFEPLGAIWLLMALSVFVLLWRRERRGAFWVAAPTVLFFLLGSTPLAEVLVSAAERPYAIGNVTALAQADAAIALGGSHRVSACDINGFSIGPSEQRILTVAELVRLGRAKTLVLGGSTQSLLGKPGVPSMRLIRDWLSALVPAGAGVTNLGICADTHDEAVQFKRMKDLEGWQRVILVTSALHMRRAEAAFRKQGVAVQTVACDFQVYGVSGRSWSPSPFPSQRRLDLLSLYLHEQVGWWVYKWRGWI